jgi:hypothetical protein
LLDRAALFGLEMIGDAALLMLVEEEADPFEASTNFAEHSSWKNP